MNKNFNEWYIDISISPEDGQLEKRISVIEAFAKSVKASDIVNLVKLYYGHDVAANFIDSFAKKFSESDPAFSSRYIEELRLLAGATLVQVAEMNPEYDSLVELLTISHSFFCEPASSSDILECIKHQFDEDRKNLREVTVPVKNDVTLDVADIEEQFETGIWDADTSEMVLNKIKDIHQAITMVKENLSTTNEQSKIYQEDSQILWWMTACWSNDLKCSFKKLDKISAAIIVGKEASDLVFNFPCPFAMQGVLSYIIESCKGNGGTVNLSSAIMKVNRGWVKDQTAAISSCEILDLLPLSSAIVRSDNTEKADEWFPKYKKEILLNSEISERTPNDYAWQTFLEMTAMNCYTVLVSEEKKNG